LKTIFKFKSGFVKINASFLPTTRIAIFNIHRLLLLLSADRGATGGVGRAAGGQWRARSAVGLVAAAVAVLIIVRRAAFFLLQFLHGTPRHHARNIGGNDLARRIVARALPRTARARFAQELFVVFRLFGEVVVLDTV